MAKSSKMMIDGKYLKLSKRETKVLEMILNDYKNREIAEELKLSDKTVSTYKLRVCRKLEVKGIIGMYLFNQKYKLVNVQEVSIR